MVSENFLVAHALLFIFTSKIYKKIFKKIFALFLQIHETPYPSFPSLSSKRDHEEMEQEDDEVMEGTDKKIKMQVKYLHKPSTIVVRTHLTISFFSNTLIPMDIQHSDIGCNKHQTIPAFQPVHLTELL